MKHTHKTQKGFWGRSVWRTLHSFAAAYTPDSANAFLNFVYDAISNLLPCDACRDNFKRKLEILPPHRYLGSNHDLFFWTYLIHDLANQDISKKYREDVSAGREPENTVKESPSFVDVKIKYFNALKGCRTCTISI
jgi:hypothetical protein